MENLKKLINSFNLLIKQLKDEEISLENALIKFEALINEFECISDGDILMIQGLKKEFQKLVQSTHRIKTIEKNICLLEKAIRDYDKKLHIKLQ